MEAARLVAVSEVLERPHGLLEGPCVIDGGVAFSDVMVGGVWAIDSHGATSVVLERRRGIGGLVATDEGDLIVTGRDVSRVAADGSLETLHADAGACGFNDIAADHDGRLLVGVLRYRPFHGDDPVPGELLRISIDGTYEVVADDLIWPNGIAVRADGTILVSDYARGQVQAFSAAGARQGTFVSMPDGTQPDGLALDADGHLWVAGGPAGTLTRVDPGGVIVEVLDVPARFVSNACFAGPNLERLFVTTADNLERPELGGTVFTGVVETPGCAAPLAHLRRRSG